MLYCTYYDSPVGRLLLAADENALTGVWMEKQKYYAAAMPSDLQSKENLPVFIKTKNWLDSYFAGGCPKISNLPLAPRGSEFRRKVWKILCEIPYGQVLTYGKIAERIARETGRAAMSAQAVGGAVGHNPISIIIPCHRVVGENGNLTGYAGGLAVKVRLLELEGVDTGRFFFPKKGTAL